MKSKIYFNWAAIVRGYKQTWRGVFLLVYLLFYVLVLLRSRCCSAAPSIFVSG